MGNRAVITTQEDLDRDGIGMYLHWNGGLDSVGPFLEYCRLRGFRGLPDDYGYARLAQVVGNFMDGGGLSVGLGPVKSLDQDNYDNGVYVVDGWEIVDRLFMRHEEQCEYDRHEFLAGIDETQPPGQRIGERMMKDLLLHGETLSSAAPMYHYDMRKRAESGEKPAIFEEGRTYLRYRYDTEPGFRIVSKGETELTAVVDGEEQICPLFHWYDGGESTIIKDGSGRYPAEPIPKARRKPLCHRDSGPDVATYNTNIKYLYAHVVLDRKLLGDTEMNGNADWQREKEAQARREDLKRCKTVEDLIERASDLWVELVACGNPEAARKIETALEALVQTRDVM